MRAVVYTEPGPSSVLRVVEREVPEPGRGEVRVGVVRSGVNPTDWKFRAFAQQQYDEVVPGQDGAGVVDAVGAGVDSVAAGDRVWLAMAQNGRAYGTAAEFTVQRAENVFRLPDGADFDLGASLGVPAVTAHRALTCAQDGPTRLGPDALAGRVVLVAGGAGAVGNTAIQLARWSGATVITTVSSEEKAALAAAAGAHHVLNYRASDVKDAIRAVAPDGVDVVVEVSPAQNNDLDLAVIKNHGTIAVYGNNGGNKFTVDVYKTFWRNVRYQFVLLYPLSPDLLRAAGADIIAAASSGGLRVGEKAGLRLHHFELEELRAAHDAVEGGAVGKVLIDVAAPPDGPVS
jgi:NADPH2:quinone reductase